MSASPKLASPMSPAADKAVQPPVTEEQEMRILSCIRAVDHGESRTPMSEGSRIPSAPSSCPPPAPCRKVETRRVALRKRKLISEFELIVVVRGTEPEQQFRQRDLATDHAMKIKKKRVRHELD